MKAIPTFDIQVHDTELLRRENDNRTYMMKLHNRNLLMNFMLEAGRFRSAEAVEGIHGGWEYPTCQLRGHFLGHWLSAAAMRYTATGDREIKAKADAIVDELAACQQNNGGEWIGPIPEKYLDWIAQGKEVWAPQYTLHKVLMGLVDMYELAGNETALQIAVAFSKWFFTWTAKFSRKEMDDILDVETGGMLEIWAQLLAITGDPMYRTLLDRYYRARLFEPLLEDKDPLTNMHANTTIPEVLGCMRAYQVTGEEKYLRIVQAYWKSAVTDRGAYVTGGQTCGEIWTPMMDMDARLGEKTQEHCTIYNMLRMADALFCQTHESKYADYIEKNLYNGIFARGYWQGRFTHGAHSEHPDHGLLTYFLPMQAGAQKNWASETDDFFCCHGTLVQANATHARYIAYQEERTLYLCQYFDAKIKVRFTDTDVSLDCKEDTQAGNFHLSSISAGRQTIFENAVRFPHRPGYLLQRMHVDTQNPVTFELRLRIPDWCTEAPKLLINDEPFAYETEQGFAVINRTWAKDDQIAWYLPRGLRAEFLPGNPHMAAFCYGPIALAGLCDEERQLYAEDVNHPELLLTPDNEREWGYWITSFRTTGQDRNFRFVPVSSIGYERYTIYFPIAQKRS